MGFINDYNALMNESFFLFIDFNIAIFAMSVIMDWIYNHNQRSILSGVLVHFCINFFGEITELPYHIMYLRTGVQVIIALAILAAWKAQPSAYLNQKETEKIK